MTRSLSLCRCVLGLVLALAGSCSWQAAWAAPLRPVAQDEAGFLPLFDGKTLDGWIGSVDGYAVEDGAIVCVPDKGGNLYTAKEYGDFILRLEFKLTPGANNGIGLRAPLEGDAAYVGLESQVLDDTAPQYAGRLKKYQYHGSIYGVLPAKTGHLKPVGEWNTQEIRVEGRNVKVTLNGEVIVEGTLAEPIDGRVHPGLERAAGHIGFLGHGAKVWFRNIRIKPLP